MWPCKMSRCADLGKCVRPASECWRRSCRRGGPRGSTSSTLQYEWALPLGVYACSMSTFNLFRGTTSGDESDPPGFHARAAELGPMLGAARVGMTVYELPP